MTVRDEKILPTVVVVIQETGTPAKEGDRDLSDAHAIAHIREITAAVIAIERVVIVGKDGIVEVEQAVVPVIAHGDPHGGGLASIVVEGVTGGVADILERAVSFVQ